MSSTRPRSPAIDWIEPCRYPWKHFGTPWLTASYTTLTEPVESRTRKAALMEPSEQVEAETELVTETLVEEVSIDGMCGVY
jgi:mycofactocin precursor peptide MftA